MSDASIAEELRLLRELMTKGLASIRQEIAALQTTDAALLARVDALEHAGQAGISAATSSSSTPSSSSSSSTNSASAPSPSPGGESGGGGQSADVLELARETAKIQAQTFYDEAEKRAERRRDEAKASCAQCGIAYFPSCAAKGDCTFHSQGWHGRGTGYVFPCCGATFRSAREAEFVEGCVRGDHVHTHHTRFPYAAHSTWISDVRKSNNTLVWVDQSVPDLEDSIPKFVVVGTTTSLAQKAYADSGPAPAALYVVLGKGANSWGSQMVHLDSETLAALCGDEDNPVRVMELSPSDLGDSSSSSSSSSSSPSRTWSMSVDIQRVSGPENGVTTYSLMASIQVASSDTPALVFVTLQETDGVFAMLRAPRLENPTPMPSAKLVDLDLEALGNALPDLVTEGEPIANPDPVPLTLHKPVGDSSLRIKGMGEVVVSQSLGSKSFTNFFNVPIKVMNPSDSKMAVVGLAGAYQNAEGEWVPVSHVKFGLGSIESASWEDSPQLTLDSMGVTNCAVQLGIEVEGKCGSTWALRARAASSLPQPLVLRIVLEDIMGEEVSLDVEQCNPKLDLYTREGFEEYNSVQLAGWVFADNHEAMSRHYVAISRKAREWSLRTSHGTTYSLDAVKMDVMAYRAHKAGASVLPLDDWTLTSSEATTEFAALVHQPGTQGPMYGVRITITTPNMKREAHIAFPPLPSSPEWIRIEDGPRNVCQSLRFSFHINELHSGDWFALFEEGESNSEYSKFWYEHPGSDVGDEGVISLTAPSAPGSYVIRHFSNAQLSVHDVESDVFVLQ